VNSGLFTKEPKQMSTEWKISSHVEHLRMESMFSAMLSKAEIIMIIKIKPMPCY